MFSSSRVKSFSAKAIMVFLPPLFLISLLTIVINESYAEQIESDSIGRFSGEMAMAMPVTVTETIKLTAFDAMASDEYGAATAVSGDTLAVGAMRDDDNGVTDSGSVYIYQRNQDGLNNWGFVKKLYASDPSSPARFGSYLVFDGDRLAVGAYVADGLNSGTGAVYIFERDYGGPNNWGQVAKVIASDGQLDDRFGWDLDLAGDVLVVGARWDNNAGGPNAGAAYIFERNQGGPDTWGEVKKLTAFDGTSSDLFGVTIAVSNDTVAVGASGDNTVDGTDAGSVYLYERNQGGSNNWGFVKQVGASDGASLDEFGRGIGLSSDTLAVGATYAGPDNSGAVYIFERDQGGSNNWGEVAILVPADSDNGDQVGRPLLLKGDRLLVGTTSGDGLSMNSGAVYLFERNAGGSNDWGEVVKYIASDGQSGDELSGFPGGSLGMSAEVVALGAWSHDAQGNNTGAAYLYDGIVVPLSLAKNVSPGIVEPGEAITYTIEFGNNSALVATSTILTDIIPIDITNISYTNSGVAITPTGFVPYIWQVADILPGDGGVITITGIVSTNLSSEGLITNTAVLTATSPGFLPAQATAVLTVNIPPELNVGSSYDINEGESITLTGTITDPGLLDSFNLVIDWGDGLSETLNYPSGTTSFQQVHLYPDDDPSGTPVDNYAVHLSLTDSDGGLDEKQAVVTVHNITPTVGIGPDITVLPGSVITFTGTISDPGLLDTFSYQWDLGEGTIVTNSLMFTYTYGEPGSYEVTLTVMDDDGGIGHDTLTVQVGSPQLFIPFIANNSCSTQFEPVDVVLAIDASNSMAASTKPGEVSKIEAAQEAAINFLDFLPFPDSQAAIVSFNSEAVLEHPLDTDQAGLTAAIQNLTLTVLTRLDLALIVSRSELLGPRHIVGSERILILLTDGIPAGTTETEVLAEAAATKAVGITIYTIGLGEDVDADLLRAVASSPDLYYEAPAADDLANVYVQIANVLQCGE